MLNIRHPWKDIAHGKRINRKPGKDPAGGVQIKGHEGTFGVVWVMRAGKAVWEGFGKGGGQTDAPDLRRLQIQPPL